LGLVSQTHRTVTCIDLFPIAAIGSA
jgi:hypothetical protein